ALAQTIDLRIFKFPGSTGLSDNQMYQLIETNYMDVNDYDEFLEDGSKYFGKKIFPQMAGLFEKKWLRFVYTLLKAIFKIRSYGNNMVKTLNQTEADGTVIFCGSMVGFSGAPYDYIADFFRGLRGISKDIHKIPEKVRVLANKFEPYMVMMADLMVKMAGAKNIFMPLHRGDANFLSFRQFQDLYWPSFKKLLLDLIDLDYIPMPSFEGYWTRDHFELFHDELPAHKIIFNLDYPTDIFMAHDILGGHSCIMGNIPHQMLVIGTPDDVREYCRKVMDQITEGLILAPGIGLPEDSKIENVRAIVEVAKKVK
ncbi:MAG TPA: uroporphyrinogen decarboxylase family protein, partial [Candidatus Deferrimicrobium sp.]|nr:uroporphyrinogen decarboxylase family protein [Candidatus Deferrimicrobium sp.]